MDYNDVLELITLIKKRCDQFSINISPSGLVSFYIVPKEANEGYLKNTDFTIEEIEGLVHSLEEIQDALNFNLKERSWERCIQTYMELA